MKTKARAFTSKNHIGSLYPVIRTGLAEAKEWNKGDVITIVERNGTGELNKY